MAEFKSAKPSTRNKLNVKLVESLLRQGKPSQHCDGDGLYLKITAPNRGSWVYRYKQDGNTARLGLGNTTLTSLSEARAKAKGYAELRLKGTDPKQHAAQQKTETKAKRSQKIITFDELADEYITAQSKGWRSPKQAPQWRSSLDTYASETIGKLALAEITTDHIKAILEPIWHDKHETASRVRSRIEAVLNYAKLLKLRSGENPAAWQGNLKIIFGNSTATRKHHPALPWAQAPALFQTLQQHNDIGSQALQLTLLTAVRTSEALGAHWREIDLEKAIWTIPAERMKSKKKAHTVPLSTQAIELLQHLPRTESGLLFEGKTPNKPASNVVMLAKISHLDAMKHAQDGIGWRDTKGSKITAHGLRSTFRDWAAETSSADNFVVEMALAHTISNAVEAAYRRGDLLERRRDLMQQWGSFCDSSRTKQA